MSPRWTRKLAMGLAVAAVVLAAAEAACRLGEDRWAPAAAVEAVGALEDGMPPHPTLGWEPIPGLKPEGDVVVRFNRLGIRGPEVPVPKPEGTVRLVATGDSSVYGFLVPEEARFVDVAARHLGVEPWAAAVPGYSTLQTLAWLDLRGEILAPDVLVVANLWSDHNVEGWVDSELLEPRGDAVGQALRHSALYRVLHHQLVVLRGPRAARRIHWDRSLRPQQDDERPRVPVQDYRVRLDALAAWARDHDADLAVLVFAEPCDLGGCPSPPSLAAYRQALRDLAAREGAPLVDGVALYRASGLGPEALWLDGLHPSVEGHRILGEALAEAVAEQVEARRSRGD